MTEPLAEVKRRAEAAVDAITEKYSVGTSSRFCDDPPDWDSAEREELIALVIAAWKALEGE